MPVAARFGLLILSGLLVLSGCVTEADVKRYEMAHQQLRTKISADYFPGVPWIVKYCVDALTNGVGDESDLAKSGLRQPDSIFDGTAYGREWEVDTFIASVKFSESNGVCSFWLPRPSPYAPNSGFDYKAHRAEIVKALASLGFAMSSTSATNPDTSAGGGIASALGISSTDIQYAKRGQTVLRLALTDSPGGRRGQYITETISKADKALLPIQ